MTAAPTAVAARELAAAGARPEQILYVANAIRVVGVRSVIGLGQDVLPDPAAGTILQALLGRLVDALAPGLLETPFQPASDTLDPAVIGSLEALALAVGVIDPASIVPVRTPLSSEGEPATDEDPR